MKKTNRMNCKYVLSASMLFAFSTAHAIKLDLAKDIPVAPKYSLFDSTSDAKFKTLSPLAQLKYFEVRKKTDDCNRVAPGVFTKNKDIRGWVALSWLRCNGGKPSSVVLDRIGKEPDLFERGPWKQSLWSTWSEQSLAAIDIQIKRKSATVEARVLVLLSFSEKLTKEDRSYLFRSLGDIAQGKKDFDRALFYFQQSNELKETATANEKIRFLRKALGITIEEKEKPVSNEEKVTSSEQQIEERVTNSLKSGDSILAIKDAVEILNTYPGSRVARRLKDKPLEIYTSLLDRSSTPAEMLIKAQETMSEADASRLTEWAQSLHRRADYKGSLVLANRALSSLRGATQATSLLWIAGRSAHFLGLYEMAMGYFDELVLKHRGSDEASEALFRMGLIQYRLKNDSMAVVLFSKVIDEKKDRYELSSRYWMYRSLQRDKSTRAEIVRNELIDLYPFSYYGIRLRAEMNNNKVSWIGADAKTETTKPSSKESTLVYLEASQNDTWKRFSELVKSGWIVEAQTELQDFPRPQNVTSQILMGRKLAEAGMSSIAIRWVSEAMDQDNGLRTKEVLSLTFPESFKDIYVKEAARNEVSERLVMSLTRQESAFNPRAVSTSSAMGLMQLIPPTAREVAQKLGYKKIEIPEDLFRPEVNIAMGTFYVADMLKTFKSTVPFALAAYNAGPTRMNIWIASRDDVQSQLTKASSSPEDEIWFDELPWNETSFYVKAILRNTLLYRLINEGDYDLSPVVWSDLVNKKTVAQ